MYPKRTKSKRIVKCGYCDNLMIYNRTKFCSTACYKNNKTVPDKIKKIKNRINQSKWRAKKYRVLALGADPDKIRDIYRNCPDGYEVDHIIPLSKGGLHHENNLQYLPKKENRRKGNRLDWCAVPDSNQHRTAYEAVALTIMLTART